MLREGTVFTDGKDIEFLPVLCGKFPCNLSTYGEDTLLEKDMPGWQCHDALMSAVNSQGVVHQNEPEVASSTVDSAAEASLCRSHGQPEWLHLLDSRDWRYALPR